MSPQLTTGDSSNCCEPTKDSCAPILRETSWLQLNGSTSRFEAWIGSYPSLFCRCLTLHYQAGWETAVPISNKISRVWVILFHIDIKTSAVFQNVFESAVGRRGESQTDQPARGTDDWPVFVGKAQALARFDRFTD